MDGRETVVTPWIEIHDNCKNLGRCFNCDAEAKFCPEDKPYCAHHFAIWWVNGMDDNLDQLMREFRLMTQVAKKWQNHPFDPHLCAIDHIKQLGSKHAIKRGY